jgi:ubiquinone/menaquinone biosynthesis C-methylase UbiE
MLEAGYACRAVEHSPQMVKAARETLRRRKLGSPDLIVQGRSQSLPFADCSFDNVVSTFPSEYIYDPATIAEIERVLRPGGRLIVVEGSSLLPIGFLQPLLLLIQMLVYGPSSILPSRRHLQNEKTYSTQQRSPARNVIPANRYTGDITTEVVEHASFGTHIPLEKCGLRRRSEIVRSQRWEVYITIGHEPPH